MHGVIGRVSPDYLRDPLIKTHGEPAVALSVKAAQPWAAIAPARAVSLAWSDSP
jgi:hypothetical protein